MMRLVKSPQNKGRLLIFTALLFLFTSLSLSIPNSPVYAADSKKSNSVTFNFVDVDLTVVTKFISDITGKNFIFDERVKGKITIIAPSKLSVDDAYNLFTSVLELKGFTVVPSGVDAYKIVPSIEAKQRGLKISTDALPLNESYIARLLVFKNISADDALKFVQPLVSKDGYISFFGPGNLLLVIDSGLNIEKILSIIELIDKPSTTDIPEIILLKNSSADTVAKLLNEGMTKSRTRPIPGQAGADTATAVADSRLNAVILFGDRSVRESMKQLLSLIDVPSSGTQGRINVYFLENADATELSKVLEGIIKGMQTAKTTPGAPAAVPVNPFEAAGGISITPDKATNSLVIVASPTDYQNISDILRQLDRRRKQVFVEAMIIEASIDKLRALGTKWRMIGQHDGDPVVITGVGQMDSSAMQSIVTGLTGFTMGGMGSFLNVPITTVDSSGNARTTNLRVPGFAALFSLSEFRDAVNVLSTPQILTSDNKEAEIVVGENVPFIAKTESNIASSTSIFNSIERKDVGITLRITPQITEGDYVKLDIYQEISSLKQEAQAIVTSVGPSTTKRSTKTSIVVKNDQMVVISGLIQEKDEDNTTKMPILGDIPLLGYLFKQKSVSKMKTNLLVFLTPHIMKDAETLSQLTSNKQNEFAVANNQYAEGEAVLRFRDGVTGEKALSVISGYSASVIQYSAKDRSYRIKLKPGQSVENAIEDLRALPEIDKAEPYYTFGSKQR